MPCSCNAKKSKYTVLYPNGSVYRVFSTKIEADAARARINGSIKVS